MLRYVCNRRQRMTSEHVHSTTILSAEIRDIKVHPNTSVMGFVVIIVMQIAYTSDLLKALMRRAAAPWYGSLQQNLRLRGCSPPTICARIDRPVNALQLCRWQFSHKEIL